MNEQNKEAISPQDIDKKIEKQRLDYEADKAELKKVIQKQRDTILTCNDLIKARDKTIDSLTEERDEAKRESFAARSLQMEKKETKQGDDFISQVNAGLDRRLAQRGVVTK